MKFNSKYIPYIIIVILLLLLGFFYQRNQALKLKERVQEQNYAAQTDSLKLEYDKRSGELEASKAVFIARSKDLVEYNEELAAELEETKGKVVTLSRAVIGLKQDTTILREALVEASQEPVTQLNDSTYDINWAMTYQYDSLNYDKYSGVSRIEINASDIQLNKHFTVTHVQSEMKSRESQIELTFGQKVEDDKLRVYIKSGYPGFVPSQLEGVLIDPNTNPYIRKLIKKKHWFTGVGVGPNITLGYDFLNARPAVIIGVGAQFNIYQW